MASKQKVSTLQAELESFGRCARALTASRLQSYPGVLKALFGEDALADPDERQRLADLVESALLKIIADMPDRTDRLVAEVVFAAKEALYDKGVYERQCYVKYHDKIDIMAQYYSRREKIVPDVAAALQGKIRAEKRTVNGVVLSPEAHRAARQLYRYAQQALIVVDAFDLCGDLAQSLRVQFKKARRDGTKLESIRHGWLGQHTDEGGSTRFRLAPTTRCPMSDLGLWAYVYFRRYLRVLLADRTGRDYLRENLPNLPADSWHDIQKGAPFQAAEVDQLLAVLAGTQFDDHFGFADDLCRDFQGQVIYDKWMKFLATREWPPQQPSSSDPFGTRKYLLILCMSLQGVFPDETRYPGEEFPMVMRAVILDGLRESIGVDVELDLADYKRVHPLADDLIECRPPRYVETNGAKPEWNDAPPDYQVYPPWPTE